MNRATTGPEGPRPIGTRAPARRRGPAARRVLLSAACVLLPLLAASGCGLFSLRNPVLPDKGIPEHYANDPDSVLLNLQTAVEHKQAGMGVFRNALADSFKFQLDPSVALSVYGTTGKVFLNRTETDAGWLSFLNQSIGPDPAKSDPLKIEFETPSAHLEPPLPNGDIFYSALPYVLTTRTAADEVKATIAAGKIDLYFAQQSTGNWAISLWVDKVGDQTDIPSLGARIESGSGHPRP